MMGCPIRVTLNTFHGGGEYRRATSSAMLSAFPGKPVKQSDMVSRSSRDFDMESRLRGLMSSKHRRRIGDAVTIERSMMYMLL